MSGHGNVDRARDATCGARGSEVEEDRDERERDGEGPDADGGRTAVNRSRSSAARRRRSRDPHRCSLGPSADGPARPCVPPSAPRWRSSCTRATGGSGGGSEVPASDRTDRPAGQRSRAGAGRRIAAAIATAMPTPIRTSPTLKTLASGSQAGMAKTSVSGSSDGRGDHDAVRVARRHPSRAPRARPGWPASSRRWRRSRPGSARHRARRAARP